MALTSFVAGKTDTDGDGRSRDVAEERGRKIVEGNRLTGTKDSFHSS